MKIQVISDIHLEFSALGKKKTINIADFFFVPTCEDPKSTILVIAGDIYPKKKFVTSKNSNGQTWIEILSAKYHSVVFVLGNHDIWGENINFVYKSINSLISNLPNVYILQNSFVLIGNMKFVGATLWTDQNKGNPMVELQSNKMNGFRKIRIGHEYRKIRPHDCISEHIRSRDYIFKNATRDTENQKVVVVTHMAPSYLSVPDKYKNTNDWLSNYYYFSDLDYHIEESDIDLWIHGHIHTESDYMIGNTRVVANPLGYPGENTSYSEKIITLA